MAREFGPDDPRYIPDDMVDALEQERTMLNPDATQEAQARDIFVMHAPAAAAAIAHIAMHGTTERVRLDASKYVVERVLGRVGDDAGGSDPLKDFLKDVENLANAAERGQGGQG